MYFGKFNIAKSWTVQLLPKEEVVMGLTKLAEPLLGSLVLMLGFIGWTGSWKNVWFLSRKDVMEYFVPAPYGDLMVSYNFTSLPRKLYQMDGLKAHPWKNWRRIIFIQNFVISFDFKILKTLVCNVYSFSKMWPCGLINFLVTKDHQSRKFISCVIYSSVAGVWLCWAMKLLWNRKIDRFTILRSAWTLPDCFNFLPNFAEKEYSKFIRQFYCGLINLTSFVTPLWHWQTQTFNLVCLL